MTLLTEQGASVGEVAGVEAAALRANGVDTAEALLLATGDGAQRARLARSTGIEPDRLLRWARLTDLLRVRGIGVATAARLVNAGVLDTGCLARCRPLSLWRWLEHRHARTGGGGAPPAPAVVGDWVEQARALPRRLHD